MSRSLPVSLPLLAIAVGALLPAGALARPSYDFDAPCYSEGDSMVFSGGGYTPNGEVNLLFSANGRIGGTYGTRADANGAIGGRLNVPDMDRFMDSSEDTTEVFSSANDRTRLDAEGPSENGAGFTTFQFARFGFRLRTPGDRDITPRRSVTVAATGYTNAVGKRAYLHYRRGGRTLKTVRLGTFKTACGNVTRTLPRAFPFKPVPAGEYTLTVNASRTSAARAPRTWDKIKVARRDAVRR